MLTLSWTPISWKDVTIDDQFWSPRLRVNREQSLPHIYQFCQETGRIGALRLNWKPGMEPVPHIFWDSDVAKWLEAASYSLATHPDPALEARVDEIVALLVAAQQPDGYLNSYFTAVEPEKRWTNLRDWHELYCAGHLIEAAVAHFQATGKRVLLDALCRYADYIDSVFGPEEGKKRGYPGHEEIELALVKLYRVTGEERYLRLSEYFINERGRQPHYYDAEARLRGEDPAAYYHKTYEYNQSHLPIREQSQVVGHAVRALYFYSAVTDIAGELHDQSLFDADQRLWQQLCSKRMYITGGLGPSAHNEGFTTDYDLPNESAYAETCAAIAFVFWNQRLLQLDCNARYADLLEHALYNGVLSGVSLDGRKFFYVNPLASSGGHHRQEWYSVSCCPPNVARLFASLGQYIYAANDNELAVHLYIQSTARVSIAGREVTVRQETNYPWNGNIALSFAMDEPASFVLRLRIPGWCRDARLLVNGEAFAITDHLEQGYVRVERVWQPGDRVELTLAMPVERVYAHPEVSQDAGLVALQRGPLIYCLEAADVVAPLQRIVVPQTAELTSHFEPELLGGMTVIRGEALIENSADWADELYRSRLPSLDTGTITAIPYYAWDNRQPGEMRVWLREGGSTTPARSDE
ncbi:MAG: glycoside hydrolase family 127 protein [Chloroflexota bacterium]|nr:glycoside hydrolase family 127 protein [Chloroflexota bacterium]